MVLFFKIRYEDKNESLGKKFISTIYSTNTVNSFVKMDLENEGKGWHIVEFNFFQYWFCAMIG